MRALLVAAAPSPGAAELVGRLAADSDIVIAVDGGGAVCREAEIVPDLLVGDLDSLPALDAEDFESRGVLVMRFPADKDDSDLALALVVARERGADEVVVTSAASGRLDHTLAGLAAIAGAADLRPRLVEPGLAAWVLAPDARHGLALVGDAALLSLLPIGGAAEVSASGVRWPLDHAVLEPTSTRGLSNRVQSGATARVEVHEGTLLALSPSTPDVPQASQL